MHGDFWLCEKIKRAHKDNFSTWPISMRTVGFAKYIRVSYNVFQEGNYLEPYSWEPAHGSSKSAPRTVYLDLVSET